MPIPVTLHTQERKYKQPPQSGKQVNEGVTIGNWIYETVVQLLAVHPNS